MITDKTVFVLGAGASVPYGFPTGSALFDKIVTDLCEPSSPIRQILLAGGLRVDKLAGFRNRLNKSGLASVDAFLEHNPDLIDVGKTAISAALIPYENPDKVFAGEFNWYKYVYGAMSSEFDSFDRNQVSFITYNYDRSLEHFFATALANTYGKEVQECVKKIMGIPIVHLHGVLSHYPLLGKASRDYTPGLNRELAEVAARNIRIVHESVEGYPEFSQAHDLLRQARVICFLGFGYNQTNLKRLWNPDFIKGRLVNIFASAYGLGAWQRQEVKDYFSTDQQAQTIEVGGPSEQILDFLKNNPILRFLRGPLDKGINMNT